MGWQDRDYARHGPPAGPVWSHGRPSAHGGRSIVTTLIVINVAVYVLGVLFPPFAGFLAGYQTVSPFGREVHRGIAELSADAVLQGQIWRLVTAQYLHAGMGHLFINMLVLHFLGRPLERLWSHRKFFAIYTLCGLFGNVFYTILGSLEWIPSWMPAVGASGCIYGLLGIVAVLFPHATVYVYFLFPVKVRTAAYIFGGIAFLTVFQRGANFGGEACHLAGLVFGVWWALRGEAWWSRRTGRLSQVRQPRPPGMGRLWRRGPGRKRTKARGFAAKVAERREDEETIDRILKKVYDGGIHSLTDAEKRALQEATERQRQRDEEAGRVDRL